MKERLTERSYNGKACYKDASEAKLKLNRVAVLERLAQYEDLAEEKRLFQVPCCIGHEVYFIPSRVNFEINIVNRMNHLNKICTQQISRITFTDADHWYAQCNLDLEYGTGHILLDSSFNETWFLSLDEATKALEALESEIGTKYMEIRRNAEKRLS